VRVRLKPLPEWIGGADDPACMNPAIVQVKVFGRAAAAAGVP
jgi:hypothetical protein